VANYNGRPWYDAPKEMPDHPQGKKTHDPLRRGLLPVGSFPPNPWGLYDTVGNAWEVVDGYYGPYPEPAGAVTDARDWTAQQEKLAWKTRIIRGGSVDTFPADCRSAYGMCHAVYGGREKSGLRLATVPTDCE